MLTFYIGKNKTGKKSSILNKISTLAKAKEEVLLIVPEQFSFEAERDMLNYLEPSLTSKVLVLNFTSLSTEIKRLYGGNTAKIIDDGAKLMLMHKAIKALSGELVYFKSQENSLRAVSTICNAVTELKQAAITVKQLQKASLNFENTALGMKLTDLCKIMNSYEALLGNTFIDPASELDYAYDKIKDNGYFKDKHVLFYGFSNFTGQQYKIIKQALGECSSVHISLCTDGDFNNEFSLFSNVNSTYSKILSIAKQLNVNVTTEQLNNELYNSSELRELENKLSNNNFNNKNYGAIKAVVADTKYDELEYVASDIHKRVRTEGLRYRDFVIIARNLSNYSNFAEGVFKTANVPIHIDQKLNFSELPYATLILSALRASRNFKTSEIYKYLKTGLTNVSHDEINEIDNYVYLWSIESKDWLSDFSKNPFGLQETPKEAIDSSLERLNSLRKKIILPLLPLCKIKSASGEEFCRAIYSFLDNCNVSKNLTEYVNEINSYGEEGLEQYLILGWKALNDIFQNIFDCYKEETLSFREFYDILQLSFASTTLGGIPQGLDQVNFISADRLISADVKHAYILGLNYGAFPSEIKSNGIFNNTEKGFLEGVDINFYSNYISDCIEEDYIAYKAITSSNNSVCLLASSGDYSSGKDLSPVFKEIIRAFDINVETFPNTENIYSLIETPMQAVNVSSRYRNTKILKDLLHNDDVSSDVKTTIKQILESDFVVPANINKNTAKLVYGNNLYISPSKLEQFYKCPYSYFFKYGLNISSRDKVDFKFMQRGTIAHYVLEKILIDNFELLSNYDAEQTIILIDKYIDEYINSTVGSVDLLDGEGKYLLKRIAAMLYDLVPYVVKELALSSFKPYRFELKISEKGEISPITINEDDFSAKIGGIVDRVDIAEIDGQAYVRIVDYKTGVKNFKFPDLLYGLNLQMLIYLCAICEDGGLGKNPAAIIYQPLNHIKLSGIDKKSNNAAKSKGVVLQDINVIKAMDPTGSYMPIAFKSDGQLAKSSSCLTSDEFSKVFMYVKQKFTDMCRRVTSGEIAPTPCNQDSQHNVCKWCEYKNICNSNEDDATTVPSMNKDEVMEIIERSVSDGI